MHSLSQNIKTMKIQGYGGTSYGISAGQTERASEVVDTAGFTGVRFIADVGAITAGGSVNFHVHGGDTTSPTTNITGAAATAFDGDDDDKIAIIEVINSPYRYMKLVYTPATENSALTSVIVELFGANGTVPDTTADLTKRIKSTTIVENV